MINIPNQCKFDISLRDKTKFLHLAEFEKQTATRSHLTITKEKKSGEG